MPNLYDEAIADAKSLKEMAERNARNKIIESISPQIRRLVERQILAEQDAEEEEEEVPNMDLEALPDEPPAPVADASVAAVPPAPMPPVPAPAVGATPAPDPDEEVTHTVTTKTASGTEVKINVRVDKHGDAKASAESEVGDGDDVEVSLNKEGLRSLADMIFDNKRYEPVNLKTIQGQFESLKRISKDLPLTESANFRSAYSILVKNMHNFRDHVISKGGTRETKQKFNHIVKEMREMSNNARFRRLLEKMEGTSRLRKEAKLVFEPTDLEGLDDEDFKQKLKGMSFAVEFAGEGEEGAEGAEMPVDVSGGDSSQAVPPAPAGETPPPPPVSEYNMDEDLEEEDMYEELEEDYMDEDLEEEDMYEDMEEGDTYEEKQEGATFHVDESMLRHELRRLREAKGKSRGKGKIGKGGIKNAMPGSYGGGMTVELPTELNKLSESSDDVEEEEVAKQALEVATKATQAAKNEREARVEESRINRELKTQLAEAARANATLREQLEEVNLFNAKLLYVNKLMQNRDLTPRQQRAIVESLDAAKSVREAKLLYTSLTESIKPKSGTVNEGRILGSSSRSTRSASPAASLNESVEVERWAVLAGIK